MIGAQTSLWSDIYQRRAAGGIYSDATSLWLLDEASGTRADSIGSNDLTDNNTVGYANMGPSGVVAALAEGNSEYFTKTSFTPDSGSISFAGWTKNPSPANYDTVLAHFTNTGFPANVSIALYTNGGFLRAVMADSAGTNSITIDSLVSLADGGWHFFVVWWDNADSKLRISVDDETPVVGTAMSGHNVGSNTLYVGSAAGAIDNWDGNLARLGYWTTALSSTLRTSLFNLGKGKSYADLTASEKVGLVSYWNLDEAGGARYDSHGSNDLTDNNTVGSATNSYPANLPGRVASFVAANSEYLSRTDASLVDWPEGDFHFAAWIKATDNGGGEQNVASKLISTGNQREWRGYFVGGQARHYLAASSDGTSEDVTVNTGVNSSSYDVWHLFEIRRSGTTIGVSVDGGAFTDGTLTGVFNGTAAFVLGARNSGTFGYYSGLQSSVAIWPRVLTSDERTSLFNAGNGVSYP